MPNVIPPKAYPLFTTTLAQSIGDGLSETITLTSVVGLTQGAEITITIDRVDSSGNPTVSNREVIRGTLSGNNIVNYTRAYDGTQAQAHSAGAVVENLLVAADWNKLIDLASSNEYVIFNEVPEGTVDGTNDTFDLQYPAVTNNDLMVVVDKVVQTYGIDYTLNADRNQIIFDTNHIPQNGSVIRVTYKISNGNLAVVENPDGSITVLPAGSSEINDQAIASFFANNYVNNEVLTGVVDGTNYTFTIANQPQEGTLSVKRNGQELVPGLEYSISGTTITLTTVPTASSTLSASYIKHL